MSYLILNRYISSKNYEKTCDMHSTSNNIGYFICSNIDEVVGILFNSMLQSFQEAK